MKLFARPESCSLPSKMSNRILLLLFTLSSEKNILKWNTSYVKIKIQRLTIIQNKDVKQYYPSNENSKKMNIFHKILHRLRHFEVYKIQCSLNHAGSCIVKEFDEIKLVNTCEQNLNLEEIDNFCEWFFFFQSFTYFFYLLILFCVCYVNVTWHERIAMWANHHSFLKIAKNAKTGGCQLKKKAPHHIIFLELLRSDIYHFTYNNLDFFINFLYFSVIWNNFMGLGFT